MDKLIWFIAGVITTVAAMTVMNSIRYFLPWQKAFFAGAKVSMVHLVGMQLRRSPAPLLVDTLIVLVQRGNEDVDIAELERYFLSHGRNATDPLRLADAYEKHVVSKESD